MAKQFIENLCNTDSAERFLGWNPYNDFPIFPNLKQHRKRYPKRHSTYGRVKVKSIQLFLGKYSFVQLCNCAIAIF